MFPYLELSVRENLRPEEAEHVLRDSISNRKFWIMVQSHKIRKKIPGYPQGHQHLFEAVPYVCVIGWSKIAVIHNFRLGFPVFWHKPVKNFLFFIYTAVYYMSRVLLMPTSHLNSWLIPFSLVKLLMLYPAGKERKIRLFLLIAPWMIYVMCITCYVLEKFCICQQCL